MVKSSIERARREGDLAQLIELSTDISPIDRPRLVEAIESCVDHGSSELHLAGFYLSSFLRTVTCVERAPRLSMSELNREFKAASGQRERGNHVLRDRIAGDPDRGFEELMASCEALRKAQAWTPYMELSLFAALLAPDLSHVLKLLQEVDRVLADAAYHGPPSQLLDVLENMRSDLAERIPLWIGFLQQDEVALGGLELGQRLALTQELTETMSIAREVRGVKHRVWQEFARLSAPSDGWFERTFKPGAAAVIRFIYKQGFYPQLGEVLLDLNRRQGWVIEQVSPTTPERLTSGNQRALLGVMRGAEKLYTFKSGGYSLPNFVLEGGTFRWLGKMNLSLLHTDNARLFELASQGYADNFEAGELTGEPAVEALLRHVATQLKLKASPD